MSSGASGPSLDVLEELAPLVDHLVDVRSGATATVDFARRRLGAERAAVARHDPAGPVLLGQSTSADTDLYRTPLPGSPWASHDAGSGTTTIDDTHHDVAFADFSRHLAGLGVRSFRSITLTPLRQRRVTLDLFSSEVAAFTDCPVHTRVVLDCVGAMMRAVDRAENLTLALETRGIIAQAQGILMERYQLSDVQAMRTLKRYSQESNVKLRDIAVRVTEGRGLDLPDAEGDA